MFVEHPDTLDAASTAARAAAHTKALFGAPDQGERQEEAMEIGRLPQPLLTWMGNPQIKTLQQLMKRLEFEVLVLKGQLRSPVAQQTPTVIYPQPAPTYKPSYPPTPPMYPLYGMPYYGGRPWEGPGW